MQANVPAESDSRGSKMAAALEPGDWLAPFETDAGAPAKVIGTFIYEDDGEPMRAIVFERPGGGQPGIVSADPNDRMALAADEELLDARDDSAARRATAERLRDLAGVLDEIALPMPSNPDYMHGDLLFSLRSVAEVHRVAELLALEVKLDSARRTSVFWPAEPKSHIRAEWFCYDRSAKVDADGGCE